MIRRLSSTNCHFFLLILIFLSCYKEKIVIPGPESNALNFIMTPEQESNVNASRRLQYEVVNPIPNLIFYNDHYLLDKFEIRGDNTLNFRRKGFSVNMDKKIHIWLTDIQSEKKFEEFKLIAMVYDYTYIENMTASLLFKEVGLWPLTNFFTELKINNHTQGLYMFIEDPAEHFIKNNNASILLRRGYYRVVKKYYTNDSLSADSIQYYISRFDKMYTNMLLYSGNQLFDTLSNYIDLTDYFKRMAVNLLIKNGDYTD